MTLAHAQTIPHPNEAESNDFSDLRLATIQNYANELSKTRLQKMAARTKNRWSPHRRAEKARLIKQQQPWNHATGPRTDDGKARSSQNAWKHGHHDAATKKIDRIVRAYTFFTRYLLQKTRVETGQGRYKHWEMTKLIQLITKTKMAFIAAGIDTAGLDAHYLVREALGISEADMIADSDQVIEKDKQDIINSWAQRRVAGEPVSRILGTREFWGLDFELSPDTLDPRPDSETLVEAALQYLGTVTFSNSKKVELEKVTVPGKPHILDLGTGTGCLLISILHECPQGTGTGIDLSEGAIKTATQNAATHGVSDRARFQQGNWADGLTESYDLILSNPPYIVESEILSLAKEVQNHDPILALDGGVDGLQAHRQIILDIKRLLKPGGRGFLEIGFQQGRDVARLVEDSGLCVIATHADIAGRTRVVEISHGDK